ncbi:MAG: Na+/H+ antiporter subunit E [Chloroflexota bacterium]|nr:MAG: Na+/H+ antiporter subunit E [Chloroflexota bacterium]
MNGLLLNILLALGWAALSGDFSPGNLMSGFGIGFVLILFSQQIMSGPSYIRKVWRILDLFVYFLIEMVLSNLRVAIDVLSPISSLRPGIVAIPLDAQTDAEITLLVNLIMLTPGTFAIDISSDRRELYLHIMDADKPDRVRKEIKDGFERRVLGVLR